MFECLGTYPLPTDLFAQSIHPSKPLVAIGLYNGRVSVIRPENGSLINTLWTTARHKGSVRALSFSHDGSSLFSAGVDGLIKCADSETGKVTSKCAIPDWEKDHPYTMHTLSPQTLLLGTDLGLLHVYDLREKLGKPQASHQPHDEYISSITSLPPTKESTSGLAKQWVSTGGTMLAVTDLRKGVVSKSEDQEVELLSSLHVSGLSKRGTNVGEKVLVGCEDGYLRLFEKGVWDDMDERVAVTPGETLDAMCLVPEKVSPQGKNVVAIGAGDGYIKFLKLGSNKVVEGGVFQHSREDGVDYLGFDVSERMISGGGNTVKIWALTEAGEDEEEQEEEEEEVKCPKKKKQKTKQHDFGGLD